MKTYDVA